MIVKQDMQMSSVDPNCGGLVSSFNYVHLFSSQPQLEISITPVLWSELNYLVLLRSENNNCIITDFT